MRLFGDGRKRWRSLGYGDGASEDEGTDFGFGKTDEGGELTEGQAEPPPKFLCEPDPLPSVQPARIAGGEQLSAYIPADFPCLKVFHGHAPLLRHSCQHHFFSLAGAGQEHPEAVVRAVDGFEAGDIDVIGWKDDTVAYLPMIGDGQLSGVEQSPPGPGAQGAERDRPATVPLIVKQPDRNIRACPENHASRSPVIVVGHDGFSVLRGLDDRVNSHIEQVILISVDGIQLAVKQQVGAAFSRCRRIMNIQRLV